MPDWLLTFFTALLTGTPIARQRIPTSEALSGNLSNFLAELEDVVQLT